MKTLIDRIFGIRLTIRQAGLVLAFSMALFAVLAVVNLNTSTGATLTNSELERQIRREKNLTREISDVWTEIGRVTAADRMEQRARQLGFITPPKVEHLVLGAPVTATATISATTRPAR